MSWVFNPFTGTLDFVNSGGGSGVINYKKEQVVDLAFLSTPDITLDTAPSINSEIVTLNGLEIDSSNYSISANILTMVTTQLRISDKIYINYEG